MKLWHTPIELPAVLSQFKQIHFFHFSKSWNEERSKRVKIKRISVDLSQKEREILCLHSLSVHEESPRKIKRRNISKKIRSLGVWKSLTPEFHIFWPVRFFLHRNRHKEKYTWTWVFGVSRLKASRSRAYNREIITRLFYSFSEKGFCPEMVF